MPDPINEQITKNVISALEGVTTANGYTFDAIVARDEPKLGQARSDRLVIVREQDEDILDDPASFTHEWMKPIAIEVYAVGADGDATSLRETANLRMADLMRAIREDPQRSTLAIDTLIRPPTQLTPDDGGYYGVAVNIDVHYRTLDNDPYTQG